MSVTDTGPLSEEEDRAPAEDEQDEKKKPFWRELPVLVVIAFAAALLIKTFLLQAFYIPSASMEPTLVAGDRVLVEKVSYLFGEPEHGDVVVFERELDMLAPEQDDSFFRDIGDGLRELFGFPTGGRQDFIKRVIAVGGETVEVTGGELKVDGVVVDEPYLPDDFVTADYPAYTVPEGEIFVMGDNRGNSDDSRSFGGFPADDVIGRAFILIWPPSDVGGL